MTETQADVRRNVKAVCDRFDDAYWSEHDDSGEFPVEFTEAIAAGGWLGIAMPEQYGGAGLGVAMGGAASLDVRYLLEASGNATSHAGMVSLRLTW